MNAKKVQELIKMGENLKILYIEDNHDVQEATIETLSQFFDHIDTASNGYEGLEMYKKYHNENKKYYDIIISDINMPKLDGISMCKEILNVYKDQYILIISAYNDSNKLQSLIEIGVTNYIQKPIDSKKFIDILYDISILVVAKQNENRKIDKIKTLNEELDALVDSFDKYVIASRTDLSGKITYASKAYEIISGYTMKQLLGKPHSIVRHPDMPKSVFKQMWEKIQNEDIWIGEVKNRRKDNTYYWVKATIGPYYDSQNRLIGYSAIREDITDKKAVEELHEKVNNLLNNAGQGFLSFDENFIIQNGYSKECLSILNHERIEKLNVADLIFNNQQEQKSLFINGIKNIINSNDPLSIELFLSLLPKTKQIDLKTIKIEYKILENNNFMMILTDITQNITLQKRLNDERLKNKMIVSVASQKSEFLHLKSDFESFLISLEKRTNFKTTLRDLHTFKGLFLQKEMFYITKTIHKLESKLKLEKTFNIKEEATLLKESFEKDLCIIKDILGEEYFIEQQKITISKESIEKIKTKIGSYLKIDNESICTNRLKEILLQIDHLNFINLYEFFTTFTNPINNIAIKLNKEINPLKIIGDKEIAIPPKFTPLLKSLIHILNNCIDHGIEEPEKRVQLNKDIKGTLTCQFRQEDKNIIIKIIDDGAGIDFDKLIKRAINNNYISKEKSLQLNKNEIIDLLFMDNLSSKDVTTTLSGRGIGLASLKENLDKFNASINIHSQKDVGTSFTITINVNKEMSYEID